jgi:hypothetical protein
MDRSIPLYFSGVSVALIVIIILASQTENVYENSNTFLLGLAGTITKLWMLFFAFTLMILFPIIGIESIRKRIKPIYLLPISFVLGHGTVIILLSAIKFTIEVTHNG